MEHPAIKILNNHRLMAISTVRPDGWPQTTMVGYVNRGFDIYFLIFRSSQKFANIKADDRVSIAVAPEPTQLSDLKAVYAGGHAIEVADEDGRAEIWRLLMERNSNLAGFKMPEATEAAFMRMKCKHVSMLDFGQRVGHREQFTIDDRGVRTEVDANHDRWPAGASISTA